MQSAKAGSRAGPSSHPRATASASASRTSTPQTQAGPSQTTDLYRPLANAIQKPLSHLIPSSIHPSAPPTTSSLFQLDPASFAGRVQNKSILLEGQATALSLPSALIRGKKLHRGHPEVRQRAKEEAERVREERAEAGVEGLRKVKVRKRNEGAVLQSGMKVSYTSMIPLNHLHLSYLTHLLSLPPLPSPLPPIPSSATSPHSSSLPPGLSAEGIQSRLCKADLTGIRLSVHSSRNPSLAGLAGIVLEETASTFRLISPDNVLRVVPKAGTVFEILLPAYAPRDFVTAGELYVGPDAAGAGGEGVGERPDPVDWDAHLATCPRIRLLLLGTAFGFRSGDRAGRKFRPAQGGGGGSGWGEEWVQGEWAGVLGAVEEDLDRRREMSGLIGKEGTDEKGLKKRKRGKSRRKDPPAWGRLEVP